MIEIGGFFELELRKSKEYHPKAISLNTARNSFEYILRVNKYEKVYLPFFICDSILEPLLKLNIAFEFYHIDKEWNIHLDKRRLKKSDLLLYVNYFGINDKKVLELIEEKSLLNFNLCIDNSQAFFSEPIKEIDTFYSARKFFGVPDGAYLYTTKILSADIPVSKSYEKSTHLLKRIDVSASSAYEEYRKNDGSHKNHPIKNMSNLSKRILSSIEYEEVRKKRWENFSYLDTFLNKSNILQLHRSTFSCPMIYPYLSQNGKEIRSYLISKGIYVAKYWPNILERMKNDTYEYKLAENLVALPVDQRYGREEMIYIIERINEYEETKRLLT